MANGSAVSNSTFRALRGLYEHAVVISGPRARGGCAQLPKNYESFYYVLTSCKGGLWKFSYGKFFDIQGHDKDGEPRRRELLLFLRLCGLFVTGLSRSCPSDLVHFCSSAKTVFRIIASECWFLKFPTSNTRRIGNNKRNCDSCKSDLRRGHFQVGIGLLSRPE